jgi:hypothetical protein
MKSKIFRIVALAVVFAAVAAGVSAESYVNQNDGKLDLAFVAETGFVKIWSHTIQIGETDDVLDYVNEGGQEILFPFSRLTAEATIADRHTIILLYQPLEIVTQVRFDDPRTIDGVTFGTAPEDGVNLTYGFPFYRISYLYDFAAASNLELAAGASLQLRNATLRFESTDGTKVVASQDLGPVPVIKIRGEYQFPGDAIPGAFIGLEADGFYATSAFINGAEYAFSGSIFDASVRAGFEPVPGFELFTNIRALGGGASGTRPPENRTFWTQSRSGFTENFLVSTSLTIGARLK